MYLYQFNKLYKFIGEDNFVYFLLLKEVSGNSIVPPSDKIASKAMEDSKNYFPINISFQNNRIVLQNYKLNKKTNSIIVRHCTLLPIVKQMGYDIDELIRKKAIFVKSLSSFQAQEQRKKDKRNKPKKDAKNILGNSSVNIEFREWINKTQKELVIKATKSENKLYTRLKKTFKDRVDKQIPFVIDGKVYYADICIKSLKLIIEIDGGYHFTKEQQTKDQNRDIAFASIGYTTIRCTNKQVDDSKFVKQIIQDILKIKEEKKLLKSFNKKIN